MDAIQAKKGHYSVTDVTDQQNEFEVARYYISRDSYDYPALHEAGRQLLKSTLIQGWFNVADDPYDRLNRCLFYGVCFAKFQSLHKEDLERLCGASPLRWVQSMIREGFKRGDCVELLIVKGNDDDSQTKCPKLKELIEHFTERHRELKEPVVDVYTGTAMYQEPDVRHMYKAPKQLAVNIKCTDPHFEWGKVFENKQKTKTTILVLSDAKDLKLAFEAAKKHHPFVLGESYDNYPKNALLQRENDPDCRHGKWTQAVLSSLTKTLTPVDCGDVLVYSVKDQIVGVRVRPKDHVCQWTLRGDVQDNPPKLELPALIDCLCNYAWQRLWHKKVEVVFVHDNTTIEAVPQLSTDTLLIVADVRFASADDFVQVANDEIVLRGLEELKTSKELLLPLPLLSELKYSSKLDPKWPATSLQNVVNKQWASYYKRKDKNECYLIKFAKSTRPDISSLNGPKNTNLLQYIIALIRVARDIGFTVTLLCTSEFVYEEGLQPVSDFFTKPWPIFAESGQQQRFKDGAGVSVCEQLPQIPFQDRQLLILLGDRAQQSLHTQFELESFQWHRWLCGSITRAYAAGCMLDAGSIMDFLEPLTSPGVCRFRVRNAIIYKDERAPPNFIIAVDARGALTDDVNKAVPGIGAFLQIEPWEVYHALHRQNRQYRLRPSTDGSDDGSPYVQLIHTTELAADSITTKGFKQQPVIEIDPIWLSHTPRWQPKTEEPATAGSMEEDTPPTSP